MPGIAGMISRQPAEACRPLVEQMVASMQHETFYVSGTHWAPELGVFAGWTAMPDSFAGCQPILGERRDVAVLLAGECYLDPEIRSGLRRRGHRFEEGSAAWLVHLYDEQGESFFAQLNGFFSGLLLDRSRGRAFLFNDRFGMERIYYHEQPDGLFFASEAKALLRVLPGLRAFNDDGVSDFLAYGCTLGTKTLFRGIQLLPNASSWRITLERREKRTYFTPATWEAQPILPPNRFAEELSRTFARVLPRYFESGRIGVSLTGGLDTRMIMACRPEAPTDLMTYTFVGTSGETLDAQLAARVAATCRLPHHLIRITPDFFATFGSLVDRTISITDGTFGTCGAHELFLNRAARAIAGIRLTGNFGSEILRAVSTFKPLGLSDALFDSSVRRSTQRTPLLDQTSHPVSFAAFTEVPQHLAGVVRAASSQVRWRTPYMDNEIVALAFRAAPPTRQSALPASELVRRRAPALSRIPTDAGVVPASQWRSLLNQGWARASFKLDYWYGDGMPHWLSAFDHGTGRLGLTLWVPGRHKYLHYARWFRAELAGFMQERLEAFSRSCNGLWNRPFLRRLAQDHIDGRRNYVREIDAVLTLDAIDRLLLRQPTNPCHLP